MANRANIHRFNLIVSLLFFTSFSSFLQAENGISLYTPYTNISVAPGEQVDYSIDIKNSGSVVKTIEVFISGLPKDWGTSLKAGGYLVNSIAVLPGEKKTLTLHIDIPMKVNKGNHRFSVVAKNYATLPIAINISEQGTFKTEFTSDQINLEGHVKSNFSFTTKLKNQTGEKQVYALHSSPPKGWKVIFKPNYKQATAVEIDPNGTSNITIDITPPFNAEAGIYKIPVQASNRMTSSELTLEVVITGTYEMELTTPSGLLSTKLTAGNEKRVELLIKNTGSSDLNTITFRSTKPKNWDVTFQTDTIPKIEAGGHAQIYASIKADDKAIPGDYAVTITANTTEVSSPASFRISVKTPLLWGWLGILIILSILIAIYYLFRKYGRR